LSHFKLNKQEILYHQIIQVSKPSSFQIIKMDMPTYFVFDSPAYILFYDWAPRRTKELVWSSFLIFAIALLHEALRRIRQLVKGYDLRTLKLLSEQNTRISCCVNLDCIKKGNGQTHSQNALFTKFKLRLLFRKYHLLQILLLGMQTTVAYFLMLAIMTYNVWIFIAMIAGTVLGYLLFSFAIPPS
jgi:Ctr copper transporter family